jgi:hypothetical protein
MRDVEQQALEEEEMGSAVVIDDPDLTAYAYETIKIRWVEQGIWGEKSDRDAIQGKPRGGRKHEEPFESGQEAEEDIGLLDELRVVEYAAFARPCAGGNPSSLCRLRQVRP